jgi:hypothetical protein
MAPMDPVSRKNYRFLPHFGKKVQVFFGEPIYFKDLIMAHEIKYGEIWKYSVDSDNWDSKESDYILYHQITCRLEDSLTGLLTANS